MNAQPIHNAATIILWRKQGDENFVLMGQRGKSAAFMPNKVVFPGGRVDAQDAEVQPLPPLASDCVERLEYDSDIAAQVLATAAIRELWEETGLILGTADHLAPDRKVPADWQSFVATGHWPSAAGMRFFFRAITPPGRPRRFDARFFLASASEVSGDLDDFSAADDELSHIRWVPLSQTSALNLPFITSVVLAELAAHLKEPTHPRPVPFFDQRDGKAKFIGL